MTKPVRYNHDRFLREALLRRKKAKSLTRKGWSLAEVGAKLGVSRQRVYQMLRQD